GAHPGFPDLNGFGRRMLDASSDEIVDMCIYQTGALLGFAAQENVRITHVMPHGQLHNALYQNPELSLTVIEALLEMQDDLDLVLAYGTGVRALKKRGLPVRSMGVADMESDDQGNIIPEKRPGEMDPE